MKQIIAFYLPQYHPTPHNNEWWGTGFTEWTNVAKARPLYPGHYQPKIPADLGFYDLRLADVRQKQTELAKEAGITGFCYYHYWFGNGQQELELPFNEVLNSGQPDFPFCLCWANESWYKKLWNKDSSMKEGSKILAEQKYLGNSDNKNHFEHLVKAFKDHRYIKIDNKPIFMIYKPLNFEKVDELIKYWNKLAIENGLDGIFFIGYSLNADEEYSEIKGLGFDAVCSCRLGNTRKKDYFWLIRRLISKILRRPIIIPYKKAITYLLKDFEKLHEDVFPTMLPNWDHTPRSGSNGYLYSGSTPELFEQHAKAVVESISKKGDDRQIAFLKSWNEWGEGNYMEPDLKYGKGFIYALKNALRINS